MTAGASIAGKRLPKTIAELRRRPEGPRAHDDAIAKDTGNDGDARALHTEAKLGELRDDVLLVLGEAAQVHVSQTARDMRMLQGEAEPSQRRRRVGRMLDAPQQRVIRARKEIREHLQVVVAGRARQ